MRGPLDRTAVKFILASETIPMLNSSLILLSTAAFCLTILSVVLSESQQRRVADWNVRAWARIDEFREHLRTKRLFMLVLEDPPLTTSLATIGSFVIGLLGMGIYGAFFVFAFAALLGGILVNANVPCLEPRIAALFWLYGLIALTALPGVFVSLQALLLSVWAVIAASFVVVVLVIELVFRRIAEHRKGPLVALTVLIAAAISLFRILIF